MTANGSVNKGVAGVSTLNLQDLSAQEKVRQADLMVLGEDDEAGVLKVKPNQFYSKEIFVDRVFAGADPGIISTKMRWIFQDFFKEDMPKYAANNLMDLGVFQQCGFNGLPSPKCAQIYGTADPLAKLQRTLAGAIRNKTNPEVLDVIVKTFNTNRMTTKQDAADYLEDFSAIRQDVIRSESAQGWMTLLGNEFNLTCEAD